MLCAILFIEKLISDRGTLITYRGIIVNVSNEDHLDAVTTMFADRVDLYK